MIEVRVRGLREAFRKMARGARKSAVVVPKAAVGEMVAEFERVLVRGARTRRLGIKRRQRPRQVRFKARKDGGGTVYAGWFGRDYRRAEQYTADARRAAATVGFRKGSRKASRRFAAIRL